MTISEVITIKGGVGMIPTPKIVAEHEVKIAKLAKVLRIDRDRVFDLMEKYPVGIDTLYKWACEGLL